MFGLNIVNNPINEQRSATYIIEVRSMRTAGYKLAIPSFSNELIYWLVGVYLTTPPVADAIECRMINELEWIWKKPIMRLPDS
jgi:hypothetical protein